jgi:NAD(P)-dependent dehydrogenase (short-subunit alcohol dehydrogenase family)
MEIKRIALVTGGNKGIGLEIARQLLQAGVDVIVGARDDQRARSAVSALAADGFDAKTVHLDLEDENSIVAAASEIGASHDRLDILVNNAGIFDFADGPPSTASVAAVQRVMNVNFIGTLAVTQEMLPLLRRASEGRILNVSSSLGSLTLNADPTSTYYAQQFIGYNASKAALNMLTVALHAELRGSNITVNSVSPGFVKTDLTGYGTMTPEEGARLPVQYALGIEGSGRFVESGGPTPW